MYARLDFKVEGDLVDSIRKLRDRIPKVSHIFFPQSDIRGQEHCGFDFLSEEPLYDWSSLSSWCNMSPRIDYPKDSCMLVCHSNQIDVASSVLHVLEKVRKTSHSFTCYYAYKPKGWKSQFFKFNIGLNDFCSPISLTLEQPPCGKNQPNFSSLRRFFWETAATNLPCLSDVAMKFPEEPEDSATLLEFSFATPNDFHLTNANGYQYLNAYIRDVSKLEETFREAINFGNRLATNINFWNVMFCGQVTSDIAPEVVTYFRKHSWTTELAFEGRYHVDFHPDQLLNTFPTEGYWSFPLFRAKIGKRDDNGADFYLIQTPNERFIELVFRTDDPQKKLKKFLETHSLELPLAEWTGPLEERWGLNKLRLK